MTSDSAIPDIESNSAVSNGESISSLCDVEIDITVIDDAESNSAVDNAESNSILPEAEVNSVLLYLKSNSASYDVESNSILANTQSNSGADASSESHLLDTNLFDFPPETMVDKNIQVQIKTEEERLLLILPTELQLPASEHNWTEIWQQIKLRLNASDRFKSVNTPVHLIAGDRLLDGRQLQDIAEILSEMQMQLKSVSTSRRQTAIAAATAGYSVEQNKRENFLNLSSQSKTTKVSQTAALYLEMTVRSGVEIRHPGSVIILGDVNPGGIVVADGDILIWGRLRGVAHAGVRGNRECLIMALQMEPTQLRIADAVARAPEKLPMQFYPEVAYVASEGIRIARASDFSKSQFNRMNQES